MPCGHHAAAVYSTDCDISHKPVRYPFAHADRNRFRIEGPHDDAAVAAPEREQCQAQPAAARRGFREDVLCASLANTTVQFHGRDVAVCRMHEATYARWGDEAEAKAAELWEWPD